MDQITQGSFRLFRVAGIDVYLHWLWFIAALLICTTPRKPDYELAIWKVAEYLCLFGIVLLHEFGHALACRSVGGHADTIVLWPLGGIAYAAPPARPGAFLWSIAAGPLVNLVLVLPTFLLWRHAASQGWEAGSPDLYRFAGNMAQLNLLLLILNLLPIYPLDGGQILMALLWYPLGRYTSLAVTSLAGLFLGGALFLMGAGLFVLGSLARIGDAGMLGAMLALVSSFIVLRSLISHGHAQAVLAVQALPRHQSCTCPQCHTNPPQGPFWVCEHCQTRFDLFELRGKCPGCGAWYLHPDCPHCHARTHIDRWFSPEPTP